MRAHGERGGPTKQPQEDHPEGNTRRATWLPATASSAARARAIVREAAADVGLDQDGTSDLVLATTEAVANAIQHGRPWPNTCILLRTQPCERGLRVEVCDRGNFNGDPEPQSLDATSGRGVPIIAAIVDHFEVRNGGGPTRVCFERHRA